MMWILLCLVVLMQGEMRVKYNEWLLLKESKDYVINLRWEYFQFQNMFIAEITNQDGQSLVNAGAQPYHYLPPTLTNNFQTKIKFIMWKGAPLVCLSTSDKNDTQTVKQIIIPGTHSSVVAQPSTKQPSSKIPSTGTGPSTPVSPIDFFTKTVNNMTDDKFIKTLKDLVEKHRDKTISPEEWQILKRLRYALTKIEIGPEHLPEWRKYV